MIMKKNYIKPACIITTVMSEASMLTSSLIVDPEQEGDQNLVKERGDWSDVWGNVSTTSVNWDE